MSLQENTENTESFRRNSSRSRSHSQGNTDPREQGLEDETPRRSRAWSASLDEKRHFSTSTGFQKSPVTDSFYLDLESANGTNETPINPKRNLSRRELVCQRLIFTSIIIVLNTAPIVLSAIGYSGIWVLVAILFFKSKDFLSVWIQVVCRIYYAVKRLFVARPPTSPSWILSLMPAYSESEEQIVKTLTSLRENKLEQHQQVVCIILDGKIRRIKEHMTEVIASFEWKYVNLKWKVATLKIDAGYVDDLPLICIEKLTNAGKKDSLVLCHDLFNYPRWNIDPNILALRKELSSKILPHLTKQPGFNGFDMIFCTDADSTIHPGALAKLADACNADSKCISACGFVYVEYEPGREWSFLNLYQQFKYSFGQIVRRGAEHYIGKVTCLPGCITMIVVRPEMAGAIAKYAKPVTAFPVLRHQVQYLGTDRRLTYSVLSQGKHLHALYIPEAGCETVAPQSLKHYLNQQRRWGSNSYFNNFFYLGGENMILVSRIAALIEIARLTLVYYRVFNTGLFLYKLITDFDIVGLAPIIGIFFLPTIWFAFSVCFFNPHLRKNWMKLVCGFFINRLIGMAMSLTVFSLVVKNLGSQAWGMSGVTAAGAAPAKAGAPAGQKLTAPPLERQETVVDEKQGRSDKGRQEKSEREA